MSVSGLQKHIYAPSEARFTGLLGGVSQPGQVHVQGKAELWLR